MLNPELRANVSNGIQYLGANFPNWWQRIDAGTINMCDPLHHVLAQVRGCLVYEAPEFSFWTRDELVACGFMPLRGKQYFAELDAEWRERIIQLYANGA